jgi:hypothetical protein
MPGAVTHRAPGSEVLPEPGMAKNTEQKTAPPASERLLREIENTVEFINSSDRLPRRSCELLSLFPLDERGFSFVSGKGRNPGAQPFGLTRLLDELPPRLNECQDNFGFRYKGDRPSLPSAFPTAPPWRLAPTGPAAASGPSSAPAGPVTGSQARRAGTVPAPPRPWRRAGCCRARDRGETRSRC